MVQLAHAAPSASHRRRRPYAFRLRALNILWGDQGQQGTRPTTLCVRQDDNRRGFAALWNHN